MGILKTVVALAALSTAALAQPRTADQPASWKWFAVLEGNYTKMANMANRLRPGDPALVYYGIAGQALNDAKDAFAGCELDHTLAMRAQNCAPADHLLNAAQAAIINFNRVIWGYEPQPTPPPAPPPSDLERR